MPPLAHGYNGTVYLVLDDFGELGRAYREADAAQNDPKTVVADLLSGQYRHPLRVVAFNTADGWMCDVTADIARELRFRGAGGRVRARPSPRQWRRCRTAASSATTQAARRLKGTARPHARPGDEPSLVRHGMSVA
jgi:hypothetical protein